VNSLTDSELLRDYTERRSEAAFAELVRRHVDLVYSAALRMVRDPHLAEDVAQGAFVALVQNARQLADRPVLSGWLHRTTRNLSANIVRSDVRRRAREQEAAAMYELFSMEPDTVWENIAPHLDAALGELSDADRDALFLRYFERKSARDMAETLRITEEAAQKRLNRAIERLRELFAKRGVTIGSSGLAVAISANAVQAAPIGLAITISTAAAIVGTGIVTTATSTASKMITMGTLQKTLVAVALLAAATVPLYRQHSAIQRLRAENARARELAASTAPASSATLGLNSAEAAELERLRQQHQELMRLRGEVSVLRQQLAESAVKRRAPSAPSAIPKEPEQPPEPVQFFWRMPMPMCRPVRLWRSAVGQRPRGSEPWFS
jgi:RNA polymerase sigma factor (sigma-70 family)